MPSDAAMKVWREALIASVDISGPNDQAAAAVIERAIADAVEQERARIVEWLRGMVEYGDPFGIHEDLADAIERGDHKEIGDD